MEFCTVAMVSLLLGTSSLVPTRKGGQSCLGNENGLFRAKSQLQSPKGRSRLVISMN